jgi:hypothetical protein
MPGALVECLVEQIEQHGADVHARSLSKRVDPVHARRVRLLLVRSRRRSRAPNRIEVLQAAHEDHPIRDRRRRYQDFAHGVGRKELVRWSGPDDEDVAVFAREVDLAICRDGGSAERAALAAEPLLIETLPVRS